MIPKLMSTSTEPSRVASDTGGQSVYGLNDNVTGQREDVCMAQVNPYADQSRDIVTEVQSVFTTLKNLGEFCDGGHSCGCT